MHLVLGNFAHDFLRGRVIAAIAVDVLMRKVRFGIWLDASSLPIAMVSIGRVCFGECVKSISGKGGVATIDVVPNDGGLANVVRRPLRAAAVPTVVQCI